MMVSHDGVRSIVKVSAKFTPCPNKMKAHPLCCRIFFQLETEGGLHADNAVVTGL